MVILWFEMEKLLEFEELIVMTHMFAEMMSYQVVFKHDSKSSYCVSVSKTSIKTFLQRLQKLSVGISIKTSHYDTNRHGISDKFQH